MGNMLETLKMGLSMGKEVMPFMKKTIICRTYTTMENGNMKCGMEMEKKIIESKAELAKLGSELAGVNVSAAGKKVRAGKRQLLLLPQLIQYVGSSNQGTTYRALQ